MDKLINNNLSVPQSVENINPSTSLGKNIFEYDLPFENYSSNLTVSRVDSHINDETLIENLQHPHNETVQLIYQDLSSRNELTVPQESFQTKHQNSTDREELKLLLQSWNQEELLDHLLSKYTYIFCIHLSICFNTNILFSGENVVIKILKIIKRHHIERLLKSFDLGTQILFENNLENWRNSLNLPLETPNTFTLSAPSSPSALSTESVPSTSGSSRFSPYKRSSTPDEISMITLSTILNETPKGNMLVEYYKKNEKFEDEQRLLLINTCAHFFEENNIKMSMATSYRLEKEILERFPTEKLVSLFKI